MRKTKIVCTLGPATDNPEILKELMHAGMNVARINFSHGNYQDQEERINIDITRDYWKYKNSKYPIIISGFDTFVEEMSQEFENAIIIE